MIYDMGELQTPLLEMNGNNHKQDRVELTASKPQGMCFKQCTCICDVQAVHSLKHVLSNLLAVTVTCSYNN